MTVYFDKRRERWRYDFYLGGIRHSGECRHPKTLARAANHGEASAIEALFRSSLPKPAKKRGNRTDVAGWVYFVATADRTHVKIGWTKKISQRLTDLQVGNHQALDPLGKIKGTVDDERSLHKQLERYRVRGEWFAYSQEVADFIALVISKTSATDNLRKLGILRDQVPPESPPEEIMPSVEVSLSA